MLILFLLVLFILFIISYNISGRDLLSPPCIICEGFIISVAFALTNWDEWGLSSYSVESVAILSVGIVSYLIGCYVCYIGNKRLIRIGNNNKKLRAKVVKPIDLSAIKIIICFILGIFTVYLQYTEIRKTVSGTSVAEVFLKYNSLLTNNLLSVEETGSFIVRQSIKLSYVVGLILVAVLINNILVEGFKRKEVVLLLSIIPFLVLNVVGSTRIGLLKYVAFVLSMFNICYHRRKGWKHSLRLKYVIYTMIFLIVTLIIFSRLRLILGRGSRFSPLYYISVYAGGSIKAFDIYITTGKSANTVVGQETFSAFLSFLHRFGLVSDPYKRLDFLNFNGNYIGNVYTAFRRYFNDFGIYGVIVLSFIAGLLFTQIFLRCRHGSTDSLLDFKAVFFSFFAWGIYMISIDECMFSTVFSMLYLTYTILLIMAYILLLRVRMEKLHIKLKKGYNYGR